MEFQEEENGKHSAYFIKFKNLLERWIFGLPIEKVLCQILARGRRRYWLERIVTRVTCKIKSLARVGSDEDPPILILEIYNRWKVVSMEKVTYQVSSGSWLFVGGGWADEQLQEYRAMIVSLRDRSQILLSWIVEATRTVSKTWSINNLKSWTLVMWGEACWRAMPARS